MADREAKLKFTAETQEMNTNIKQSESSLKNLRSELKLNSSEMKANGESADNLKNRLNILGNEMQSARDKTQAVSDKLDAAKDIFGENSVEVQNLQTQLNNCQSVENGIQADINATTESLNQQNDANSELNSQLDSLNGTIESTSGQLEVNAAQLENADDKTDLLNERMGLLQEQYDASNEKVALLSDALQESANTSGTTSDEYHNLESALQSAMIENENIKSSISSTQESMSGSTMTIGDMIEGFKNIPGAAGIAVTAIKEIGGACLDAAEEVKTGYDEIIERTGATGDRLEELKDIMDETFSSLPTEAETAGAAVGELDTRFKNLSEGELQALSDKFVKFSDITNTNVTDSIALASQTMNKYGMDVSEVDGYLDAVAYTSQATGVNTSTLMQTVMGNSDVFKLYGMSVDEAVQFVGSMEVTGTNATEVLGQMRRKADDLAKASGTTARDGIEQLTSAMTNAADDTEALSIASDVFSGTTASKLAEAAQLGKLNFDDLSLSASDYADTVNTTFETTQNGADKFKEATNNMKVSGGELGDMFLEDVATPLVNSVTPALDTLRDSLNGDSKQAMEDYSTAIGDGSIQIGSLQDQLASGIVGLSFFKDGIKQMASDTSSDFENLKSGASACFDELKVGIPNKANELKNGAVEKFESLRSGALDKLENLKSGANEKIESLKSSTNAKFSEMKTNAVERFEELRSGAVAKIDAAKEKVLSTVEKIKGAFNFSWKLPDIGVPSISVVGGVAPYGIGGKGSLPSFNVEWHAIGGIFTRPTLLQGANGFHGVGESGPEAIMPISKMYDYVEEAVYTTMATMNTPIDYDLIGEKFLEAAKSIKFSAKVSERELLRIIEDIT